MITFSLTRPTRAEVIAELQTIFSRSAWLDLLVTRVEMAYSDVGGKATVQVALWGHDNEIKQELQEAGIE